LDINTPYINDPFQQNILRKSMHGKMQYTLMNDFLAKYSLQTDLYALKGLLAALLSVELDKITAIKVLNPIELSDTISDKDCLLDVKLELNHSEIINIEIQARFQDFWPERSLTYLCRTFDHLKTGENYSSIKPCLHIGILNTDLFKADDPRFTGEFYSDYRLLNTSTHTEYSRKFGIRVLSLNRLENASEEDKSNPNGLYHWARLFRSSTWEDLYMIAKENERMESFVGTIRQLSAEEKVAQMCEARRRYNLDIATYEHYIAERDSELAEKEAILAEKDSELAEKESALAEKDSALAEKDSALAEKDSALAEKDSALAEKESTIATQNSEIQRLKEELSKYQNNT